MIEKERGNRRIPRKSSLYEENSTVRPSSGSEASTSRGFLGSAKHKGEKELMNSREGQIFLKATEDGDRNYFLIYIEQGGDVNYQDEKTGQSALHIAAGTSDKFQIRALVNCNRCNFLLEDNSGALASDIAFQHSHAPEIARYLELLEADQRNVSESFGIIDPNP